MESSQRQAIVALRNVFLVIAVLLLGVTLSIVVSHLVANNQLIKHASGSVNTQFMQGM